MKGKRNIVRITIRISILSFGRKALNPTLMLVPYFKIEAHREEMKGHGYVSNSMYLIYSKLKIEEIVFHIYLIVIRIASRLGHLGQEILFPRAHEDR